MKRFLALLLALTMTLSIAPAEVFAAPAEPDTSASADVTEQLPAYAVEPDQLPDSNDGEAVAPGETEAPPAVDEDVAPPANTVDPAEPADPVDPVLPAEPEVPGIETDGLPVIGGQLPAPEIPTGPSDSVILPFDYGIALMSIPVADNTYYAAAGSAQASLSDIYIPDEYRISSGYKRVFAVDDSGNIVASTDPAIADAASSSSATLYFVREPVAGEKFALKLYGGTVSDANAYDIGTLEIVADPIVTDVWFSTNFLTDSASCDISVTISGLKGEPDTDYLVTIIDDAGAVVASSGANGGGGFQYMQNYGSDNSTVILSYKLLRTAELDTSKVYSVKVSRIDGGVLYSTAKTASMTPEEHVAAMAIAAEAAGPVSIADVTIDTTNSALLVKLENFMADTDYNVAVYATTFTSYMTVTAKPDENGVITVPLTSWLGSEYGISPNMTYNVSVSGPNGSASKAVYPSSVADSTFMTIMSMNSTYLYKSSSTEYTVATTGYNNAAKAIYEADNPTIELRKLNYSSTGTLTSSTRVGSFTISEKNVVHTYINNTIVDVYQFSGTVRPTAALSMTNTLSYALYYNNKLWSYVYGIYDSAPGTVGTAALTASGFNAVTGKVYNVVPNATAGSVSITKRVLWSVLGKIGISFYAYGANAEKLTVKVMDSEGNVVMTKESAGTATTSSTGFNHVVYFDKPASGLTTGEFYTVTATDGASVANVADNVEYSGEKVIPIMSLNSYSSETGDFSVSASVNNFGISNDYYPRNYTIEDVQSNKFPIRRLSDGKVFDGSFVQKVEANGMPYLTYKTTEPLTFGVYNTGSYSSILISSDNAPRVSPGGSQVGDEINITGAKNFPTGNYTGYILYYNYSDRGYYWSKVPLTVSDGSVKFTMTDLMKQFNGATMSLFIFCNEQLVTSTTFYYYQSSASTTPTPGPGTQLPYETIDATVYAVNRSVLSGNPNAIRGYSPLRSYSFVSSSAIAFMVTAADKYTSYRYATDENSLKSKSYSSLTQYKVNDFGDQYKAAQFNYDLSKEGWTNFYFQFKDSSGNESTVLPFSVLYVKSSADPKITSVAFPSSSLFQHDEVVLVPTNSAVPVVIHCNDPSIPANGIIYYVPVYKNGTPSSMYQVGISSVEKCQGHENCYTVLGYIYSLANVKALEDQYGEFTALRFYPAAGNTEALTNYYEVKASFDDTVPLEEKNLSIQVSNSYINSKTKINGFGAIPGASVTVTFTGSGTHTVTVDADSDGMFVFTAPEAAEEGYYTVTATCTKDDVTRTTKNNYSFTIDNTAPKITNGTARINSDDPNNGEDGAIITWSDDDYNALITLKKIEGEAETTLIDGVRVGNRSYIDVEPVTLTTKYVIYAVDQAGNKSEEVIITFEDKEPPTTPSSLTKKSCTTTSMTITWGASKDNVGVQKYIISRYETDYHEAVYFEVPGDTLEFTDTGLIMGTTYNYSVKAVDYAGNTSNNKSTTFRVGYFMFGNARYTEGSNGVQLQVSIPEKLIISGYVLLSTNDIRGIEYDYSGVDADVQYRLAGDENEWVSVPMEIDPDNPQRRNFTLDLKDLVDKPGKYEYRFHGVDIYGGEGYGYFDSYYNPGVYTFEILKDTTPPTIRVTTPSNGNGGTVGIDNDKTIVVYASDDVKLQRIDLDAYINDGNEPVRHWDRELENKKASNESGTLNFSEFRDKLKTGDKVIIKITATDASGNVSEPVTVTYTINADKPKPVTNLSVKERSNDIYLDWDRPEGYDVSKILEDAYTIYRSTSPDGPFEKIGTVWEWPRSSMMNTSYFTDSTIPEAGTYYYYVTAKNEVGNESDPSEIIEAKCALDYESPVITLFIPEDGAEQRKTVKLFASATDNYKLGQAVFEYQKAGDEKWTAIKTVKLEEADRDTVGSFSGDWDISKLEEGEYTVKVSVYDASAVDGSHKANAPAVKTATIKVLKYSAPVAPVLSVETTNSTATLTWTYSGNIDGAAKFEIYTCDTEKGEFKLFKTVAPSALSYEFSLNKNAYYNVKAVDVYGESAVSNTVNAVLKPTDSEKPVAVISPENDIIAAVGEPVKLSAELSSDNTGIVSYSWTFGDGLSSTGVNVTHTYTADNGYTVTLTVKDAAGNVGTADANVKVVDLSSNSEYLKLELTVVDGAVGASKTVPGAMLTFHTEDSTILDKTYTADENGKISVILKKAVYTVSCVASGYSQTTKTLNLVPYTGTFEQLFAISSGNLVSGELTAKEMTKEEIIEAGIDYSDPKNRHIDKFTVTLNFYEGLDVKYEVVLGHKNRETGEFTTGGPVHLEHEGKGVNGEGEISSIWAYPISEHFLLVIYGEAHWLKEMYQVDLMVLNGNQVEHLEDVKAELVLPDGLSFAAMNAGSQSAEQYADIIGSSESKTFTWYVRGDKEGSYYLTANVNAVSVEGAASSDVSETYKTSEPIRVYAGSALQMTVTAPSLARRGEMYYVQIDLENVSGKPIYDLVFHIDGVEQYKVLDYKDDEKMILLDSTTKDLTVPAKVFNPGDKIRVTIGTNILFNGAVELIRYSKFSAILDPVYVLSLMSKASLEGSTTSIPCKCIIEPVGKVGLLDGTIAEGIEKFFGFEKLLGYKKDFDFTGSAIEVLGEIFDIPMVSEAMTTLELLDVESEYTYDVTVEHGTPGANTISGNVVEIESANTENSYIDASSGSMKLTSGGLNIKAVAPGEETVIIKAVPADPEKNVERTYKFNVIVTDGEVKSTVTAEPNGVETVYVDSAEAVKALEDLTEQALEEAMDNPYEHFDSVYAIDSGADDAHVGLKAAEISAVMGRDFVTHIGIESENADVKLDRQVIEQLSGKDMAVDVVKLTEDEAASKFGETYKTSPTYEVTLKSGGAEVSELKGKAEIAIPYKFASGEDENSIVVQHIDDGGNAEQLDFEYKDGSVVFETDSFSCFRITKLTDELPKSSPEITGDVFSGGKLKAAVEGAEDGDLVYKWYRGDNFDEPIYVGAEYTIQPEDSEQKLTVRAYGTGDPYSEDLYVSAEIEIPDLSETYIKGDVNNDGRVNLLDVNLVIDYISNGYSSEGMKVFIKPAAYINDDSAINVLDVNALIDLITS